MGRVEDILLRRRHTYRFPISDHPDYPARRPYFDALADFTELGEDDFLDGGYVSPPWLYCEAGTTLWRRMIEHGRVKGADANPPRRTALLDVVLAVSSAAEQRGEPELIAMWYRLGFHILVPGTPLSADELGADPAVRELRAAMDRTGAWSAKLPRGYHPTDEDLEYLDDERETWWHNPGQAPVR
jgi:hypothetical protein